MEIRLAGLRSLLGVTVLALSGRDPFQTHYGIGRKVSELQDAGRT
jgi:hypothetical protein